MNRQCAVVAFRPVLQRAPSHSSKEEGSDVITEKGIVYAVHGGDEPELDIVRPPREDGPYPALILIHGGRFKEGNREMMCDVARIAAKRGYVSTTIDYHLSKPLGSEDIDEYRVLAPLHDVKPAVYLTFATIVRPDHGTRAEA